MSPTKLLGTTALMIVVGGLSAAHAQSIGTTVRAEKTVKAGSSRVLKTKSQVFANERIRANSSGLGHFKFNDGTKMVVGPGTNLVLDKTIYNPNGSTFKKFAIDSSAGALRFISGSSGSNAYEIQTPTGTLGVRGTAFDLQHYRGRTYVMLASGEVTFCSNSGSCETITRRCDFVVASPDGKISPPIQPRNGIYNSRDMARYFPFIADQSQIEPGFRLAVSRCGGGGLASGGGLGDGQDGSGISIGGDVGSE